MLLSNCLLQRGRGCVAAGLGKDDHEPRRAKLYSVVSQHHCSHQGNATRVTLETASPFWGLGLGWGCGAVQLPALQPQHPARHGGGFALFTLQLWLWLEFVKGSG